MSDTYHYANLTKREWFAADALGGNSKVAGIGLNLTARAFDLLLLGGLGAGATVGPGRWSGDCITLIGDSDENWLGYLEEFADIEADVILMLYARDGFDRIAEAAEGDQRLFMELCHLVVTRQALQLEPQLKERFGADFRQRYKAYCMERLWFKPKNLAFP